MMTFCCMPPEKVSRLASSSRSGGRPSLPSSSATFAPGAGRSRGRSRGARRDGRGSRFSFTVRSGTMFCARRSSATRPMPSADRLCRRPRIDGASVHANGAAVAAPEAEDRLDRLRAAGADEAAEAERSRPAGRRRKRRARWEARSRLATSSTIAPFGDGLQRLPARVDGAEVLADHVADDVGLAERGGLEVARHRGALAHHGHPVGDRRAPPRAGARRRSSAAAVVAQARHDVEQPVDLGGAERGGRLVEDDEARRRAPSALAISTSWRCAAESRRTSASSGRTWSWPRRARMACGALAQRRKRQAPGPAELGQEDVLEHRHVGREAGLLRDEGDAGPQRVARRGHGRGARRCSRSRRRRG